MEVERIDASSLAVYGVSEPSVAKDRVVVEWATESRCCPTFATAIILGDRHGTLVADLLGISTDTPIGSVKLEFGDNRYRRKSAEIGSLYFTAASSGVLIVTLSKTSFEQAGFQFLEEILPATSGVQQVLYLQNRSLNSSFLMRKLSPGGSLRLSNLSKHITNSFLQPFESIPAVPEGFYAHSTAAAVLNHAQLLQLAATVLYVDIDRDDLLSVAQELFRITQHVASGLSMPLASTLDKEVYTSWRRRMMVDEIGHLYM